MIAKKLGCINLKVIEKYIIRPIGLYLEYYHTCIGYCNLK